jgi:ATP-dependent protease ClpP protease subunit
VAEASVVRIKNLVVWSGDISFENFAKFRTEMESAIGEAVDGKVIVEVCSGGGKTCVGLATYDFLHSLQKRNIQVETIASGGVMSAAISVFLGGSIRKAHKNAIFFVHSTSGSVNGRVEEKSLDDEAKSVKFFNVKVKAQILEACGSKLSKRALDGFVKNSFEFDAQEALRLGFIHEII